MPRETSSDLRVRHRDRSRDRDRGDRDINRNHRDRKRSPIPPPPPRLGHRSPSRSPRRNRSPSPRPHRSDSRKLGGPPPRSHEPEPEEPNRRTIRDRRDHDRDDHRDRERRSRKPRSISESNSESNSKHSSLSRRRKDKDRSTSTSKKSKKKRAKSKTSKKKGRGRSRSSSTSSSSSASSADSFKLLLRLEEERKKQQEETRKRKELLKALETPEEKRQRRIAKKEAKEIKRKERMGWDTEYLHYSNTDNPFGDHALMDSFMWKKKLEKDGMSDLTREEVERINRLKQEENKRELEKVKKARLERERLRAQRDEEEALLQREKEAAQFQEWGNNEDIFHLEQATLRSKIRIKDGRAKPIDLLAQYISAEDEVDAIEMHEPYTYLNGLTISDLEDLIEDIKVYEQLEKGKNLSYWTDITVIVEDELRKLRKLEVEDDDSYRVALERREGINPSVAKDVASVFKGKTAEQLQALKQQIQAKLDGSTSGVDISYWESLLSQLKAHIARAQLRDRHQENLKRKLELLKAQQGVELNSDGEPQTEIPKDSPKPGTSRPSGTRAVNPDEIDIDETSQESKPSTSAAAASASSAEEEEEETIEIDECHQKYLQGSYSPKLITNEEIEPGIFVIGEDEDNARLDLARNQVLNAGAKVENVWTAEEKALQQEAKKGMGNDEATFAVESQLDTQVYLWSDKYRPRKPRYFNRVHTGFEWNKYNQTHYDMDNPPPKIVQGYKFNIFYPDLIDKNSTPQYFLTACADNPDFAILRFHAGPPYEDIAFKIVNREWEYSYKRGFRCQFHNNIFQLWFHFKRYRYRR